MARKKRGSESIRKPLVWCQEAEDEGRYLTVQDEYTCGTVNPDTSDATLEELADLCDQEAESINAHEFVGAHRLLAALLHRELGREQATGLLRTIAELGGLDGMNGICGQDDAFGELGIPDPWKDWKLA